MDIAAKVEINFCYFTYNELENHGTIQGKQVLMCIICNIHFLHITSDQFDVNKKVIIYR